MATAPFTVAAALIPMAMTSEALVPLPALVPIAILSFPITDIPAL
jgi:hypothetical protein